MQKASAALGLALAVALASPLNYARGVRLTASPRG